MNRKARLLILNPTCLEVIESHRSYLDQTGLHWRGDEELACLREERIDELFRDANALILPASIRDLPRAEHMRRHTSLKVLSIAASGYDWLDVNAATANGIVVTYAPVHEGVEVVADMTWALMLAVARRVPHHHQRICSGDYGRGMGTSVWGKTLGIIGLGRIGQAVARRAKGFDMRILAAEPEPDIEFVQKCGVEIVALETLLRQSDFVSLHVRLNDHTRNMISRSQLAMMKPTAFLVNTARRELVDAEALAGAILAGRMAGAALDDPPTGPDRALLGRPDVVFAPHHGNRAIEGAHAVFRCAIDNATAVLQGRRPELVVNPEVYDGPLRAREELHGG